jgi:protein-L-isoaspartate(D-aspartate) O-methyltransferase
MDQREAMLRHIEVEAMATAHRTHHPVLSSRVLAAMQAVPRDRFIPAGQAGRAYANAPVPIGHGQTISQPFVVALMTDLLALPPDATVLEIGSGSGYQAAVLAELTPHVYSIEIIPALAEHATWVLAETGHGSRVTLRVGDGALGWPERAPFDGIIVTAAPPRVPTALIEQLRPGGRMVIPVGPAWNAQALWVLQKDAAGTVTSHSVLDVAFVPLTAPR